MDDIVLISRSEPPYFRWMCLQWNHFSDNVLALPLQLENLKEGLDFTDVTLACQITQFEPILADGVADRTATI